MRIITTAIMVCLTITIFCQTTTIEGYVFESGNRGYLSNVSITAEDMETSKIIGKSKSNKEGFFQIPVPVNSKIRLYASKDMFDIKRIETEVGEGKSFIKMEMGRAPGYTFEVTLAEKKATPNATVDAITGTRIEVYNNTTRESLMDLKDHDAPTFQLNLKKGNHYTILIRKNGFLSKRMEAKVDVEGCILCFEGVGNVGPGVSENLTENNLFGVLLANVELERLFEGKTMEVQNLYYNLAKWNLTGAAKNELNKVITLMKDNPNLTIELGAHTDSRGNSALNLDLSQKRAKSAVRYLIKKGGISQNRIVSKGYGENQLLNDCTNGVDCPEEKHAINRRTELKIVGITDITEVKSLAQMKKEEQLESEILGLMDQEQIQAKDEEALKKIIEEREMTERPQNVATDSTRSEETLPNRQEGTKVGERENIEEIGETGEMGEVEEMGKIGNNEKIEEIEVMQEIEKAIEETKERKDIITDTEVVRKGGMVEENVILSEVEKGALEEEIELVDTEILLDQETDISKTEAGNPEVEKEASLEQLPPVTDGIKVILHQSESILGKDHFIFLRHRNVEIYDNGRGKYYYLIGGFRTELDAYKFKQSFIAPDKKYKESFVAKFTKGIMSVVNH